MTAIPLSDSPVSDSTLALSYAVTNLDAAHRALAEAEVLSEACSGPLCPIGEALAVNLHEALMSGDLEDVWQGTITLAQEAVGCKDDCPGVGKLLDVMGLISAVPAELQAPAWTQRTA